MIEYSIIVESYTLDEGGDWSRFRKSLAAARLLALEDGLGEVLVIDVCGLPELRGILANEFPDVKTIDATGMGYDSGKMKAVHAATGKFILFLDGDCLPLPGWKLHLLDDLRRGDAVAAGGYTRYDGGFMAEVCSILDFGFLYPCVARDLKCYAFNNCGFLREALLAVPAGGKNLRCSCYHHAQQFQRRGTPMRLVPEARVLHEMQPLIRERTRQGFDTIAACWEDPDVPEARLSRLGVFSIPLFYAMNVLLDWRRAFSARTPLGQPLLRCLLSLPLFPLLRILDVAGMFQAFLGGRREGGWGGNLLKRRSAAAK